MNNEDAYTFLTAQKNKTITSLASSFIVLNNLEETEHDTVRRKFSTLREDRREYLKRADITTWNAIPFHTPLKHPRLSTGYQCSDEVMVIGSVSSSQSTSVFEEDFSKPTRKPLRELSTKGLRSRLSSLLTHLEKVAVQENVSSKELSCYLMMLCSQTEYDFTTTKFCKEIIAKGSFGPVCNKLTCDKAAFLMDSLEIGKKKYIDLRRFLLSDVQLPGYNRLATYRSQICLTNDIFSVDREHRVGIAVSYKKLLTRTVNRILTASANEIPSASNPKRIRISDGLDGSGSHRVYQQATHPNISTKSFILFGFKVISISDTDNKLIWKNPLPNSPFSIRPVAILALQENEDNIRYLMDTLINKESTEITEKGLELTSGFCEVEIQRSQLDGKMAKIISGAGVATTTGNVVRRCLIRKDDNDQDFLYWVLTVIPSEFKSHIIEIHTCLGAILRVYNSSRRVDTEELALVCSNIYQSILCAFPWANVSPTLHKLLAHASEIISTFNDGHGLENLSEEGLEASNKYIRRYRDRLARKFSFEENLKDVFVRLISHSDPMLLMNRKFSIPRPPSSQGLRSSQDILVNTLIRDHEDYNDD
ncbi:Dna-mediated transposase [Oopsacas minuta]|uniref:Dna-mediated transposase n=1 Tax=Oopsacas minuta TaxID=111878 RepID=A0AAV7KJ65_9METZ|nr:Dna-mediated transposase [Oopsacas minuta]